MNRPEPDRHGIAVATLRARMGREAESLRERLVVARAAYAGRAAYLEGGANAAIDVMAPILKEAEQ